MNGIARVLSEAVELGPIADQAAFWARLAAFEARAAGSETASGERALLGGFVADRLGYAFAAGYQAALGRLVPGLGGQPACLCATEAGGAHPSAIATRLAPDPEAPGAFRLSGHKRWATLAGPEVVLLVVATTGTDHASEGGGRARLALVKVASQAAGVRLEAMPPTPFAPELGHVQVHLDGVAIRAEDVVPGDGYSAFLKPFRTIEDVHVMLALMGYLVRETRAHGLPEALAERAIALAVALDALTRADPNESATHVALGGILALERELVTAFEGPWAAKAPEAHQRFVRDRPLLGVAGSARTQRLAKAWERLAGA